MHLEPMLCNKRSQNNEKPVQSNKEQPLFVATKESLQAAMKSQRDQKKKKNLTKRIWKRVKKLRGFIPPRAKELGVGGEMYLETQIT